MIEEGRTVGAARAFTLHVSESEVDELRRRVRETRWPDQAPDDGAWSRGTSLRYLEKLAERWTTSFDWREHEEAINRYPQFMMEDAGALLHFLHVRGTGRDPRPLLLLHGWPSSVFEFLELIPVLTDPGRYGGDPERAFSVVVPSLPGFGLSFAAGQPRAGIAEMSTQLHHLMTRVLGYPSFGVHGGDVGAYVATAMAMAAPESVTGLHLTFLPLVDREKDRADLSAEDRTFFADDRTWRASEQGYATVQGTKPQTLSFALTDSPSGLAAWIVEKMYSWSDRTDDDQPAIDPDQMLANISLYWFTRSIGSTFSPYWDARHGGWPDGTPGPVEVPVGYAEFPREIRRPPRSLVQRRMPNIRRWSVMPRGGHFAAIEQPQLLANEIFGFFADVWTTRRSE